MSRIRLAIIACFAYTSCQALALELKNLHSNLEQLQKAQKPTLILKEKTSTSKTYQIDDAQIVIKQGNIVKENVDAIVSAANEDPNMWKRGGGVAGVISGASFSEKQKTTWQAHVEDMNPGINYAELKNNPRKHVGEAYITKAEKKEVPYQYVIHAIGPNCTGKGKSGNSFPPTFPQAMSGEAQTRLRNAYQNSLKKAASENLTSIAFPFISSAIFKCNNNDAARFALTSIIDYFKENPGTSVKHVHFMIYNSPETYTLFTNILAG